MFILQYLFNLFILPIESFLDIFLRGFYSWSNSAVVSLLLLSLVVSIITSILVNWLTSSIKVNSTKKKLIDKKVKDFKSVFKGKELYFVVRTLYRQHKYHPIQSMVGSLALLVQLPFFIAAYVLLKDNVVLNGANFLFIKDLLKPDNLLWGINLLPLLLFIISILGSYLIIKDKNLRLQNILLAFVFFVVLYNMPSGLVLYWILNNIFALINLTLIRKLLSTYNANNYLIYIKKVFPTLFLLFIFILIFPFYGNMDNNIANVVSLDFSKNFIYLVFLSSIILTLIISIIALFFPNRLSFLLILTVFFVIVSVFVDRFVNSYGLLLHFVVFFVALACAFFLNNYFKIIKTVLVTVVIVLVVLVGYQFTRYSNKFLKIEPHNLLNRANIKLDGRNVYYISFDGYLSKDVWEYLYPDIHNEIYSYLKNNGFTFYNKSYGGGSTVETMVRVTSMMPIKKGNPNIASGNGSVYRIFKQNGYKNINYFSYRRFIKCGSYVDICERYNYGINGFYVIYYKSILHLNVREVVADTRFTSSFNTLKKAQLVKNHKHIFMHIQYPNHSPNPPKGWDKKTKYMPNFPQLAVKLSLDDNIYIKQFVNYVIKNDPNAIIVLASDHGMHMNRASVTPHPLTKQQDDYATLLTVRWPKDCKKCKDYEIYDMANLYRYIFITLNTNNKEDIIKKTMIKTDKKLIKK